MNVVLDHPAGARAVVVLAHGAGAGMRHKFMHDLARALNERGLAVLRYEFPYMEAGRNRVDSPAVAEATVRAAVAAAPGDLPVFAAGKSFGGRMSSRAAAFPPGLDVRGLIFYGFPLHPPRKPSIDRAAHLPDVPAPMLFLQGTRDDLADLELIRQVTAPLPNTTLHIVEHADHSFAVLKRSGRTNQEVLDELADQTSLFTERVLSAPA